MEIMSISRQPKKDRASGAWLHEISLLLISMFASVPIQMLNYHTMTQSGVTKEAYPWFHLIMYKYNTHISLALFCVWFVTFVMGLKKKMCVRYQLSQLCSAVLAFALQMIALPAMNLICRYGRFWYLFPQAQIAYNDAFAYFAGKTFGKHKLIKISPNKTVEGFIGGLIGNMITTMIISDFTLNSPAKDFWLCRTHEYTLAPFYHYTCNEYDYIY